MEIEKGSEINCIQHPVCARDCAKYIDKVISQPTWEDTVIPILTTINLTLKMGSARYSKYKCHDNLGVIIANLNDTISFIFERTAILESSAFRQHMQWLVINMLIPCIRASRSILDHFFIINVAEVPIAWLLVPVFRQRWLLSLSWMQPHPMDVIVT